MPVEKRRQRLVWIGNGMAGMRSVEEVLALEPGSFELTIIGGEPVRSYNRILLSSALQGEVSVDSIYSQPEAWFSDHQINLYLGETVEWIDSDEKVVLTDHNRTIPYDKLIIATGSSPFVLPVPGHDMEGVFTFRTMKDCLELLKTSSKYKRATVIGGGLLGLEAAKGFIHMGMSVDVVHRASSLMERQLDPTAAGLLQKELETQGMRFHLDKETTSITGFNRVERVNFSDHSFIDTDIVIMSAGVRPNISLAKKNGIKTNRGILVDDRMCTSVTDIYAVGECVEHRELTYGMVKPLYEQSKVLAQELCGLDGALFRGTTLSTQLKIPGVDLFSVGEVTESGTTNSIMYMDEANSHYKRLFFKGDCLTGAILYGNTDGSTRLVDLVAQQTELSSTEKNQLLYTEGDSDSFIADMPSSELICQCNAVSKKEIIQAVQKEGLATVDEVKSCTKAASSCGGCKPLVSNLLSYIQSDLFDEIVETVPALCTCTTYTEAEIVEGMYRHELTSIEAIHSFYEWKDTGGCNFCAGALIYYLSVLDPMYIPFHFKENAVKQTDGRYAVSLPFYQGTNDAERFRKIAQYLQQYPEARMNITTYSELQLTGIQKDDLATVWKIFSLPSKALLENRLLITNSINRCACNQSAALTISSEMNDWFAWIPLPHTTKLSVQACSHGALHGDIQIAKSVVGWEIHIGEGEENQLFYIMPKEKEVTELLPILVQYYRQTAYFQESIGSWMNRMGQIHVREMIYDSGFALDRIDDLNKTRMYVKHHLNLDMKELV
ncbi:nitrite reductase large subunit NirB [Alkalicoccobacillus gibsonii]|uniref:nitrite reductase large subunit NirB n=1 Tax=Alkalicoccobacillus gibsonii TaxID=79881 RepID=UPI003518FF59